MAGQCIKFCEFSRHSVEGYQLTDEDVVCVFEMRNFAMCMKEGIGSCVFVCGLESIIAKINANLMPVL